MNTGALFRKKESRKNFKCLKNILSRLMSVIVFAKYADSIYRDKMMENKE